MKSLHSRILPWAALRLPLPNPNAKQIVASTKSETQAQFNENVLANKYSVLSCIVSWNRKRTLEEKPRNVH